MLPGVTPLVLGSSNLAFYDALRKLNLTANLGLVVDSGDIKSYPGNGQVLSDVSGGGVNFNLGGTSSTEASDPTFGGIAGRLSQNEVFTLDGGDYFTLAAANPSWIQSMHKASAKWTVACWFNLSTWANAIWGNMGSTTGNTGVRLSYDSLGRSTLFVRNAGNDVRNAASNVPIVAGAWTFTAISLDATVGANGIQLNTNGSQESFTSTFSSPSTGNASFTFQLGAGGNNLIPMAANSLIGCFAIWTGLALTQTQMEAIRQATRSRFRV